MTRVRRSAIGLATALLLLGSIPANAGQLEDDLAAVAVRIAAMKEKIAAADAEQTEITARILDSETRLVGLVADLEAAATDRALIEAEVAQREAELDRVRLDLQSMLGSLASTRIELDTTESETRQWAREMYMTAGGAPSVVDVVFSAQEFTDVALGLEYANRLAVRSEQTVHRLEALQRQEERQVLLVEDQEAEMAADLYALTTTRAQLADLESQIAERTRLVEEELATQRVQLAELEEEEDFFENELVVLEAEEEGLRQILAEQQSRGGTGPDDMVRPVPGAISSGFGPRRHPILGYVRMHNGVDMNASYGDTIIAAADGRVIYSGWRGGYGNAVIIDHGGGVATLYAHMSSIAADYGEWVDGGDTIGYIGSTGLSTGPHLHFEVRVNGDPVDPEDYL
jgi:murein DD-endopeptidase MepM/ murein hydrolase activator NlpD